MEEQQEGNDAESQQREIELLKQEGELPLEDLLRMLKGPAVITLAPRWGSILRERMNSALCHVLGVELEEANVQRIKMHPLSGMG